MSDDDWDVDLDEVNDLDKGNSRWGGAAAKDDGDDHVTMEALRQKVISDDNKTKESVKGHFAYGYGGAFGVEKDRMDKSAVHASYKGQVEKHASTDAKMGYGGQYGVLADRQDKSAVGWEHKESTDKHASQKDYKQGFGGKFGLQKDRQDKCALDFESSKYRPTVAPKPKFESNISVGSIKSRFEKSRRGEEGDRGASDIRAARLEQERREREAAAAAARARGVDHRPEPPKEAGTPDRVAEARALVQQRLQEAKATEERLAQQREAEAQLAKQRAAEKAAAEQKAAAERAAAEQRDAERRRMEEESERRRLEELERQQQHEAALEEQRRIAERREAEERARLEEEERRRVAENERKRQEQLRLEQEERLRLEAERARLQEEERLRKLDTLEAAAAAPAQYPQPTAAAVATGGEQPGSVVLALYDYTAEDDTELSFLAGDTIRDVNRCHEDWWVGTCGGRSGMFPANYVSPIEDQGQPQAEYLEPVSSDQQQPDPAASSQPKAIAMYDYEAAAEDELGFYIDDVITVVNMEDPGWWYGTVGSRAGVFPANYVQLL